MAASSARASSITSIEKELEKLKAQLDRARTQALARAEKELGKLKKDADMAAAKLKDYRDKLQQSRARHKKNNSKAARDAIKKWQEHLKQQRLENQLNQLSEKIDNEGAVKRWLDNGFTLLENAKSQLDDSPQRSLETISKVEQIIQRIEKMV